MKRLLKTIVFWLKVMRAPFFTASIAPVFLGVSVAWFETRCFDFWLFLLTLIGAISAHAGANIINDYFDHLSGNDEANRYYNVFTGGSRMIQNGLLTPEKTLLASVIAFFMTIIIGLYLNWKMPGNVILWIGIFGIFLGVVYSAKPIKLSYRGIGELAIMIAFGPLITIGSYYVQARMVTWLPVIASIPAGILVGLILFINEFQDFEADRAFGKNTLVVHLKQKRKALRVYQFWLIFSFIWILAFIVLGFFPIWTAIVFILTPWLVWTLITSDKRYDKIYELLPVNASTIGIHFFVILLLSAGFLMATL